MSTLGRRTAAIIRNLVLFPVHVWRLATYGLARLDDTLAHSRRAAKISADAASSVGHVQAHVTRVDEDVRAVGTEVRAVRRELRDRLLQYHLQLGRLSRGVGTAGRAPRLSGRSIPVAVEQAGEPSWEPVPGASGADPTGIQWQLLDRCPVCGHGESTIVSAWNKLILLAKAPDQTSARYDYAICHACGVLYASRRPTGERYRFLLTHFGEVTAKRGENADITNPVLYPYPLTDRDRQQLQRLAAAGVFVSDHLNVRSTDHLAGLLRDRFENSAHVDILGSLLNPRGARVLEVRSRVGTILDGLRRAYDARVFAMPIWESQQFLLREVYGIETSDLIDFEEFRVSFDEPFDIIICNHMLTHVLRPAAFFDEVRRHLTPGGHIYLHNEPDDAEFLGGKQSMLATLNPLHVQAFDQRSLMRALSANGFETVFVKRRHFNHLCLARLADARPVAMSPRERRRRLGEYQQAYDRAVLGVDERLRPRFSAEWAGAVQRGVAAGTAEFDERGRLRLVARQ